MKKHLRNVLLALLGGALIVSMAGCGKKSETEEPKKEFVYVPEYVELNLGCDNIGQVVSSGDTLFIAGSSMDEESGMIQGNYIYKYNILDKTNEQLPVTLPENCNIYQMTVNAAGNLMAIVNTYSGEDDASAQSIYEIMEISADGKVVNTQDITAIFNADENAYVQYFCIDGLGNMYLTSGQESIHVLDKNLKKICDFSITDWIDSMVTSKEGDVYVSIYGANGMELKKLDLTTKSLGAAVAGTNSFNNASFYTGVEKSLLSDDSSTVGLFDIQTGETEELFDWLDADVNNMNISNVGELSDGRIWAISTEYSDEDSKTELIIFAKTKASEVAQKETITYGTLWLNYDVRERIINYNKTNEKYHIDVKEYVEDDIEAGLAQFNADIVGANCPDLIDLSSISYSQYASKGVLEDLYPYMEKSGVNKDDYLENILKAYEIDGKLYGLASQFYINTVAAKQSKTGDIQGWTLTEMLDFVKGQNPENIFLYGSRDLIFYYCVYNNMDEFINWETGECYFKDEGFIRTLDFAASFPEEIDFDNEDDGGTSSMIRSDKVLLMQTSISSVQEYQMMNGLFGEQTAFVGYPNNERKGNLIQPSGASVGIASKSKHKDAAWEFIHSMISEETQNGLIDQRGGSMGFPILKSALDKQFEKDMTAEYYTDESGEKTEQSKTSWGYDDFSMDIYAATQEDVDAVKAIIASAERLTSNSNEELNKIITEETQAFFAGQKTSADTADVIQNRIQIYVNENR